MQGKGVFHECAIGAQPWVLREQAAVPASPPGRGRRWLTALLTLFMALAALGPWPANAAVPADTPPLRVRFAPEKDYGPFIYEDSDGAVRGLSMDMLVALAEPAGLQLEILPAQPLKDILAAAQRGEVDLISSLRPTPERAQWLGFTRSYATVPAVLVTLPMARQPGLPDFKGQRVAVGRGYAVEAFVREKYPEVQWVALADDAQSLQQLQQGLVSAVVADVASVYFAVDRLGLGNLQVHANIGFEYPLSFAFLKSRPDIGERLENALRQLPEAQRQVLRQRWLEGRQQGGEDARVRWLTRLGLSLAGLALLGLALAWWRSRGAAADEA